MRGWAVGRLVRVEVGNVVSGQAGMTDWGCLDWVCIVLWRRRGGRRGGWVCCLVDGEGLVADEAVEGSGKAVNVLTIDASW